MGLQWPQPIYTDGNLALAMACTLPEFESPLPSVTTEYVFRQDFMQFRLNFAPTALDTPHPSAGQSPDFSSFLLMNEGPRKDAGNGIVRWTRTYAKVPADHDEYESFAYNFIGFTGVWFGIVSGGASSIAVTGRPRRTQVITSRVAHTYVSTTTPSTITTIKAQRYTYDVLSAGQDTDFVADAIGAFSATIPSRTQYNALTAGGSGLGTGAANGEFVAEDSRISRWLGTGNIWLRQTRYVFAI